MLFTQHLHFYLLVFIESFWFVFSLIYGFFMVCYLSLFRDPSIGYYFGKTYSWIAFKIGGITLEKTGFEHITSPAVFVGNHQSIFDIALACSMVPRRTVCIAKRSFIFIPVFGFLWWLSGQIFIHRTNRSDAINTLDNAKRRIQQQGDSVWIFPEGTRNYGGTTLLPFKKGAFHLAIQAGVPIIATVFTPLSSVIDVKHAIWRGGVFRIKVLPPFPTKGLTAGDVDNLINQVRTEMQKALDELTPKDKTK